MSKVSARGLSLNFSLDSFTGNGSTTAFTLSNTPYSSSAMLVFVDGLPQASSNFSLSGTTLTFTSAPAAPTDILVWYMRSI